MQIIKKKDLLEVGLDYSTKDVVKFVSDVTDLFEFIHVGKSYHLTKKEKLFFIASVVCYLTSPNDVEKTYKDICGIKGSYDKVRREISRYTGTLAKKNWVKKTGRKTYELPPFFSSIDKDVNFNIRYRYEADREDKSPSIGVKEPESSYA